MSINNSWKIRKRAKACSHTGVAFEDGDCFFTGLFEDLVEDGVFLRKDFCEEAWQELHAKLEPFSFWRSAFEAPPAVEEEAAVKKETAEDLLRRLVEEDREYTENARYILAVMLERDKVLREVDAKETEGAKFRIYEHRQSGDVLIVRDPELRLDEVDGIQAEVIALLEGESSEEKAAFDQPPGADCGDDEAQGDGDSAPIGGEVEPSAEGEKAETDNTDLAELDTEIEADEGEEEAVSEVVSGEHVCNTESVDEPETKDDSQS